MTIQIFEPKELPIEALFGIYQLILSGGQVSVAPSVLMKQICSCKYIAVGIEKLDGIVACAAIKKPQKAYRLKIQDATNVEINTELELGYCVTRKAFQGRGIGLTLAHALMQKIPNTTVFSTTSTEAMRSILTKLGFQYKALYVNDNNKEIDLYIYEVQFQ